MGGQGRQAAAFSGYRDTKFGFSLEKGRQAEELSLRLQDVIGETIAGGFRDFYCGAARGFDILAGESVLAWRKEVPDVRLVCAVPFPGQERRWGSAWRERYRRLLGAADEVTPVCPVYTAGCYHARNRYMVDHASLLICYYDGQPGGTAYTLRYALQQGLTVVNIAPEGTFDEPQVP